MVGAEPMQLEKGHRGHNTVRYMVPLAGSSCICSGLCDLELFVGSLVVGRKAQQWGQGIAGKTWLGEGSQGTTSIDGYRFVGEQATYPF